MKVLRISKKDGSDDVVLESTQVITVDIVDGCLVVGTGTTSIGFEADEWAGFLGYER